MKSMGATTIISIEILQSVSLWASYKIGCKQVKENSNVENQKMLFWSNPKQIKTYIKTDGFDVKYQSQWDLGKGLYFTDDAS